MIDTQCRGSTWRRLGPTIVLLLAIPLTAADPLRHVLQGALGLLFFAAAALTPCTANADADLFAQCGLRYHAS
jgi:hypothetical protein